MPGHKGGRILSTPISDLLGKKVFLADVTNIPGMDDLHQPHGVILEAQRKAAVVFGADYTYFLVNGSSCGLQAMIMAACNPGDKIAVPRNIHRSILGGIIFSGAVPVYFMPEYDRQYGIPLGTTPETIEQCLSRHADIKAVLVVNPTYHGIVSDIRSIAAIAHLHNIPLLVDEAHGPHLGFHEALPSGSLSSGADIAVHGTHKILGAFTQASMLHLKGDLIDRRRLEAALRLVQSTSTSYLLLASLDATTAQMETAGRKLIDHAVRVAAYARTQLKEIEGIDTFGAEICGRPEAFGLDPTKVTVLARNLAVTGFWLEKQLRRDYNIQVEMADLHHILLMISFSSWRRDVDQFTAALQSITGRLKRGLLERAITIEEKYTFPPLPEMILPPRDAFFLPITTLPLEDAVHKISAEIIACYPPGIPVVCPGEKITDEIIDYLVAMRKAGAHFQGCHDQELRKIAVIA
jgi:lysine decarboxylase